MSDQYNSLSCVSKLLKEVHHSFAILIIKIARGFISKDKVTRFIVYIAACLLGIKGISILICKPTIKAIVVIMMLEVMSLKNSSNAILLVVKPWRSFILTVDLF